MFDQASAFALLQQSFDALKRSGTITQNIDLTPETQLLGPQSSLDSIGFVTLITDIEDRLTIATGKECYIVLNEIMTFNVNTPSLTAESLSRYIAKLSYGE